MSAMGSTLSACGSDSLVATLTLGQAIQGLPNAYLLAPIGAVIALVFAFLFYVGFMKNSEGEPEMVRIAKAVREGAYAYLGRQAKVVAMVIVALVVVLIIMSSAGLQAKLTPLGVLIASIFSGLCGYLGMKTATNASARTAAAAKESLTRRWSPACAMQQPSPPGSVWMWITGIVMHQYVPG